jgi:hypothetical protein
VRLPALHGFPVERVLVAGAPRFDTFSL